MLIVLVKKLQQEYLFEVSTSAILYVFLLMNEVFVWVVWLYTWLSHGKVAVAKKYLINNNTSRYVYLY